MKAGRPVIALDGAYKFLPIVHGAMGCSPLQIHATFAPNSI